MSHFPELFNALTGFEPFPWQKQMYQLMITDKTPQVCEIPTGLGKTSIMAIWLLALNHHIKNGTEFTRRLVYVVNRRTVVDQATKEAETILKNLSENPELKHISDRLSTLSINGDPLIISTLRGQFADNSKWSQDISCPAIIVGTIDMIGSRLLFSGYRSGFKTRHTHAGILGQNSLIVHDEAHLEPAFQMLLEAITKEQQKKDLYPMQTIALTATPRGINGDMFQLSTDDKAHPVVKKRIYAEKILRIYTTEIKKVADRVAELALNHKASGQAIIIYLRTLRDVKRVVVNLKKEKATFEVLTGTLRSQERNQLALSNPVYARFIKTDTTPITGTVFLICTSAGEVGVDISADHLICDLTSFESMIQRFGRVNRYGLTKASQIDVVYAEGNFKKENKENKEKARASNKYEKTRIETFKALQRLPRLPEHQEGVSANPDALSTLQGIQGAYSPISKVSPVTDTLFNLWAMTTITDDLPGRPPVASFLHGKLQNDIPNTKVVWREEVGLTCDLNPDELLERWPIKPNEILRDSSPNVLIELRKLLKLNPDVVVWVLKDSGKSQETTLQEIIDQKDILYNNTLILPPAIGGFYQGLLLGTKQYDEKISYDISCVDSDRVRLWDTEEIPQGYEKYYTVTQEDHTWHWFKKSRARIKFGTKKQTLETHSNEVFKNAMFFVKSLNLRKTLHYAVAEASKGHDLGKGVSIWQLAVGNLEYPKTVLAKSLFMNPSLLNHYRHELGSVQALTEDAGFQSLDTKDQDLILHLVAAHHGRARPHFPPNECVGLESYVEETPYRYIRLQNTYGRWGLAYLEAFICASDILSSKQD